MKAHPNASDLEMRYVILILVFLKSLKTLAATVYTDREKGWHTFYSFYSCGVREMKDCLSLHFSGLGLFPFPKQLNILFIFN